eukprot:3936362-Rhodomonas_salina.1
MTSYAQSLYWSVDAVQRACTGDASAALAVTCLHLHWSRTPVLFLLSPPRGLLGEMLHRNYVLNPRPH